MVDTKGGENVKTNTKVTNKEVISEVGKQKITEVPEADTNSTTEVVTGGENSKIRIKVPNEETTTKVEEKKGH